MLLNASKRAVSVVIVHRPWVQFPALFAVAVVDLPLRLLHQQDHLKWVQDAGGQNAMLVHTALLVEYVIHVLEAITALGHIMALYAVQVPTVKTVLVRVVLVPPGIVVTQVMPTVSQLRLLHHLHRHLPHLAHTINLTA